MHHVTTVNIAWTTSSDKSKKASIKAGNILFISAFCDESCSIPLTQDALNQ